MNGDSRSIRWISQYNYTSRALSVHKRVVPKVLELNDVQVGRGCAAAYKATGESFEVSNPRIL